MSGTHPRTANGPIRRRAGLAGIVLALMLIVGQSGLMVASANTSDRSRDAGSTSDTTVVTTGERTDSSGESSSIASRSSSGGSSTAARASRTNGPRASTAQAVFIPSNFFTVVDQGGANDEVSQSDLTQMGRDNSDPMKYQLFWSWDSTDDWTGTGQTGDACALFDSNGNGLIDFAICVRLNNPNPDPAQVKQVIGAKDGDSPFVWTCNDKTSDRCSGPSGPLPFTPTELKAGDLVTLASDANLITDTDPFPLLDSTQNTPNDSTIRIDVLKSFLPAGATLVNVCSFPSAGNGGNNDPKDCIVTRGGGYLKIVKDAGGDTSTRFNFTVNPDNISKFIVGSGNTGAFTVPIGTNFSVAEAAVGGWDLTNAVCTLEGGTGTGSWSGSTVSSIAVQSGKITTCTFTNVKRLPSMTVDKTTTTATLSAPATVNYSYLVTNTGNVPLTGIGLVDNNDNNDMSCPATTLAVGANMTCTASHTFTQAELDANGSPTAGSGKLTNTVTASSNEAPDATDTLNIPISQSSTLSLVKSASPSTYSKVGDIISYSYVVTNTGNVTLAGPVTVTDDKATVTCPAGGLAPGASMTCTASYTITQADLNGGSVKNTAQAHANSIDSNFDDETVTALTSSTLSLVKSASPSTYSKVGDIISYSYVVTNTGNVTLAGPVTVTDDKATVTCPAGGLAPGASMTCTASYTITQADLNGGSVKNTAQAHANSIDSNFDDETVTALIVPPPPPSPAVGGIQIDKTGPASAHVGDTITYSFAVSLVAGSPGVNSVSVSDPMCDAGTLTSPTKTGGDQDTTLEQGEVWTYSCKHATTASDSDPLPNTATVSGVDVSGHAVSDNDSHQVDIIHPEITIAKEADPTQGSPGDRIKYTYKVKNSGDVTLTDISVDDDVLGHVCDIPQLGPGQTARCTASFIIPEDSGITITNVAIAGGTDPLGLEVRDQDDATIDVVLGTTVTPTKTPPGGVAFTGAAAAIPLGGVALLFLTLGSALMWAGRRRGKNAAE